MNSPKYIPLSQLLFCTDVSSKPTPIPTHSFSFFQRPFIMPHCQCPLGSSGNGFPGQGCQKRLQLILISVGSIIAVAVITLCFAKCYIAQKNQRLRTENFHKNGGFLMNRHFSGTDHVNVARFFTASELKKATKNYSLKRIIGSGGNGTVFKGILPNGTVIAIKKSQEIDKNHIDQFINELAILAHINHKNIVKLLGCCMETEVPLLVYEYITNGTLYQTLHEHVPTGSFSWNDRIRVAVEIAEALAYLHNNETMTIVHRDVKSSNILLDENYTVKLADFGISKSVAVSKGLVSTAVKGTVGYLDPEYFKSGKLTEKSDVYSYGVVLLELLTNLKAVGDEEGSDASCLAMHFLMHAEQGDILGIFEEATLKMVRAEELIVLMEIVKLCLRTKGEDRPTMDEVVKAIGCLIGIGDCLSIGVSH